MHGKTESENDVANAFKEAGAMYEKAGSVESAWQLRVPLANNTRLTPTAATHCVTFLRNHRGGGSVGTRRRAVHGDVAVVTGGEGTTRIHACDWSLVPDNGVVIIDVAVIVQIFKQIAEMHEEAHNSEKALEFYERAADTFRADVRPGRA